MLKREWSAENNGKLPHLFIPSKTATLIPEIAAEDLPLGGTATSVPEFAVENLPLGRSATLVPEFAVKDLPLGRTLMLMMMMMMMMIFIISMYLKRLKQSMPNYLRSCFSEISDYG